MLKLTNDAALAMRKTEQILCFSFIHLFLLQVSSLHYPASWPRNLPGPCGLRPCFMQLAGRDDSIRVRNFPQALGFRCAHCTGEFATRQAMGCHRRTKFSLGTGCADPSNSNLSASPCLLLVVPVFHRQFFGNMMS